MSPKYILGFSLIEVLVSLLLLSFILLGFEAAEIYSLRAIRAAEYFNSATIQINNMSERLQIVAEQGSLLTQVAAWNSENNQVLPQGRGEVEGVYPMYRISIFWGDVSGHCEQNQLGNSGCISRKISMA
jgi:Tfp pilus assembly protein PilV